MNSNLKKFVGLVIILTAPLVAVFAMTGPAAAPMVHDAWVRATAPHVTTAAIYLTLHNPGVTDQTLVRVSSPQARTLELHETTTDAQGVSRMAPLKEVIIPAGGKVALTPGGKHIMVYGLAQALVPGQELPLRLEFASGPATHARVQIVPPDALGAKAADEHHHH